MWFSFSLQSYIYCWVLDQDQIKYIPDGLSGKEKLCSWKDIRKGGKQTYVAPGDGNGYVFALGAMTAVLPIFFFRVSDPGRD